MFLAGGWLLWRSRPPLPRGADPFSSPRVINDLVTYRPLLADLDLLLGAGDIDFTTLTDDEWAVLLEGADRSVAEKTEGIQPEEPSIGDAAKKAH